MGRDRYRPWCLPMLLAWLVVGAAPVEGASFALDAGEREEATSVGRRSVTREDFGAEWRVEDGSGQTVMVMTPFHRLALAARNAAFRTQSLRAREIDSLLKEYEGKLVLWVTLRGRRPDFARFYAPTLLQGQREIRPEFAQNERTALPVEEGGYLARSRYVFPAGELNGRGRLLLVVRDAEERQVARFAVDLGAMR